MKGCLHDTLRARAMGLAQTAFGLMAPTPLVACRSFVFPKESRVKLSPIIQVFIGAGVGGALRYAVGGWIAERWGATFPWHTMAINVGGSLLLGMLMALSVERGVVSSEWRLVLGVGVLGGFTTFSTLSYESIALLEEGMILQGAGNMFGSAVLGLAAAVVGLFMGRAI